MPAKKISIENAKQDKLFYFVANAVIYRESDGKCLILRRSESEKVHPGKYAVPGGKLEWEDFDITNPTRINGDVLDFEDSVETLLAREIKEEAGIEVFPEIFYVNSVGFVRPDETPVILVKFAMRYKSGEIKFEDKSFDDYAWVDQHEVREYDCIKGIPEEIKKTIEIFNKK